MAPCGQPLLIPYGIERKAGLFEAVQVIGDPCAEGSHRADHFPARTGQGLFDAGRFGRTDRAPHQPVALETAQRQRQHALGDAANAALQRWGHTAERGTGASGSSRVDFSR